MLPPKHRAHTAPVIAGGAGGSSGGAGQPCWCRCCRACSWQRSLEVGHPEAAADGLLHTSGRAANTCGSGSSGVLPEWHARLWRASQPHVLCTQHTLAEVAATVLRSGQADAAAVCLAACPTSTAGPPWPVLQACSSRSGPPSPPPPSACRCSSSAPSTRWGIRRALAPRVSSTAGTCNGGVVHRCLLGRLGSNVGAPLKPMALPPARAAGHLWSPGGGQQLPGGAGADAAGACLWHVSPRSAGDGLRAWATRPEWGACRCKETVPRPEQPAPDGQLQGYRGSQSGVPPGTCCCTRCAPAALRRCGCIGVHAIMAPPPPPLQVLCFGIFSGKVHGRGAGVLCHPHLLQRHRLLDDWPAGKCSGAGRPRAAPLTRVARKHRACVASPVAVRQTESPNKPTHPPTHPHAYAPPPPPAAHLQQVCHLHLLHGAVPAGGRQPGASRLRHLPGCRHLGCGGQPGKASRLQAPIRRQPPTLPKPRWGAVPLPPPSVLISAGWPGR